MPRAYKCDECEIYFDKLPGEEVTVDKTFHYGEGKGLRHFENPNYHVYTKRLINRYIGDGDETRAILCEKCHKKIYKKAK